MKYFFVFSMFIVICSLASATDNQINKQNFLHYVAAHTYQNEWVKQFGTHFLKYYALRTAIATTFEPEPGPEGRSCERIIGKLVGMPLVVIEESYAFQKALIDPEKIKMKPQYASENFLVYLVACIFPVPQEWDKLNR